MQVFSFKHALIHGNLNSQDNILIILRGNGQHDFGGHAVCGVIMSPEVEGNCGMIEINGIFDINQTIRIIQRDPDVRNVLG